jgi:ubiquinone/menaquinone biosynthesis C-methylase UbiE
MVVRTSFATLSSTVKPLASASGYDLVAKYYDNWAWQSFWRSNEFPLVLSRLQSALPMRRLLDIGVGTGAFLSYAAPHLTPRPQFVGVDISSGMLEQGRSHASVGVELVRADVREGLPFRRNCFDVVIMMRVANHLANLDKAVSEIASVLSPGGTFVATDFAADFNYVCTRIPTPEGKVSIETYKHTDVEWDRVLKANFSAADEAVFTASTLSDPHAGDFNPRLTDQNAPIFRLIAARRSAKVR